MYLHKNQNIPEAVTFEYGGSTHTIVITEDTNTCSHCKKPGHKTEACRFKINRINRDPEQITTTPNSTSQQTQQYEEINNTDTQPTIRPTESNTKDNHKKQTPKQLPLPININPEAQEEIHNIQQNSNIDTNIEEETPNNSKDEGKPQKPEPYKSINTQTAVKRTAPPLSSVGSAESLTESTQPNNETNTETKTRQPTKTKRTRSHSPWAPTEEWLKPVANLFDSFILSYDQIYSLIENLNNNPDPISTIKEYTEDIDQVVNKLKEVYNHTKARSAKCRITKIINKIEQQQNETSSEEECIES